MIKVGDNTGCFRSGCTRNREPTELGSSVDISFERKNSNTLVAVSEQICSSIALCASDMPLVVFMTIVGDVGLVMMGW